MTPHATARRLPGIRFESRPPAPRAVLPRMDVAAFVGFAETGPVDVPVAVEDVAQFEEVFGRDPRLFWDPESGRDVRGYLASTVRAFFRGGGIRCWAVRVTARTATRRPGGGRTFSSVATRGRFPLPGIIRVTRGGTPRPGVVQAEMAARAVGSWSDGVELAAGLTSLPLRVVPGSLTFAGSPPSDGARPRCVLEGHPSVREGDLVRVAFPTAGVRLIFVVAEVTRRDDPRTTWVVGRDPLWVTPVAPASPPGPLTGLAWPGGHPDGTGVVVEVAGGGRSGAADVTFDVDLGPGTGAGTLIPIEVPGHGAGVLAVDAVAVGRAIPGTGSPPDPAGGEPVTRVLGRLLLTSGAPPGVAGLDAAGPVEVLTLELRARVQGGRTLVVSDLGLTPLHPRHAGLLPTDEDVYSGEATNDDPRPRTRPQLWEDALRPRFPLAGLPAEEPHVLYPVDARALGGATFLGPRPAPERALRRDGLHELDAAIFVDPELVEVGTDALGETADFLRYRSPRPRRLVGAHALLEVDEVTVVAAPDATHRPWRPAEALPPPEAPPHEPFVAEVECREVHHPERAASPPEPEPEGALSIRRPDSHFEDRAAPTPPIPVLDVQLPDSHGSIHVEWTAAGADGVEYVLQECRDPWSWAGAHDVYRGPLARVDLFGRSPGRYAYRVRAVAGGVSSDWSTGRAVEVARGEPWVHVPPEAPAPPSPTALAVHRALVRMCAARGDILAVLSAPADLREPDVIEHVTALRGRRAVGEGTARRVPPLAGDERTLSFGALYHPWAVGAREDGPQDLRAVPPDGAAAAVLARRALARGAWVAPANEPVPGVIALAPPSTGAWFGPLQDAHVNVVRQEPRGFLWLSADTLSADPDLRQVNVRRLLSLLRRVALRHGPPFVFEPNDDALRRRIREAFEDVLLHLHERGAFAGAVPAEAFRVAVSAPPNTPASLEQGRLIVEVKVAPSIPMRFLTVRVVGADGVLTVEGA